MSKEEFFNEDQILKECNFDYFYNCEECSRELCMFYNDIVKQKNNFNTRQAIIDLGRIAITLNQLLKRIKDLEAKLAESEDCNNMLHKCLTEKDIEIETKNEENAELKQQFHDLPAEIMREIEEKQPKFTDNSYGFTARQGFNMCVEILDRYFRTKI